MSHCGTQSRLASLTMWKIRQQTMLVFVQYIFQENVHEDMTCTLLLPTNTKAAELFKSLNDYILGKLNWSFCVSTCMDRVATMTGQISGFTTCIKEVAFKCESTHCVSIEKCWLPEKCHLNLTTFCRM